MHNKRGLLFFAESSHIQAHEIRKLRKIHTKYCKKYY